MTKILLPLAEPKYGKPVTILVWINGEFDRFEQKVKLNPSHVRSWSGVLDFLTAVLKPRFGAVRKLYHLATKKMVDCLSGIVLNEKYVAVGPEKVRFKKNGYSYQTEAEMLEIRDKKSSKNCVNVEDYIINFMDYTKKKNRTVIYVMVSGRKCQDPLKVVLTETDLGTWDMVLEFLGYQLDVPEGIEYLCRSNGKKVFTPRQIRHGELYVAVPFNNRFVNMEYAKLFEEIKRSTPNNIKNPKKHRSAVYVTKRKHKPGKKSPPLSSARCVNPTCQIRNCHWLYGHSCTYTQEVQTGVCCLNHKGVHVHLDPHQQIVNSEESKDEVLNPSEGSEVSEKNDKGASTTNLSKPKIDEVMDSALLDLKKLGEEKKIMAEDKIDEESSESDEEATYPTDIELLKSLIDEIIDSVLLDLEQAGKITPPHLSRAVSIQLAPVSDKMFIPNQEEKRSITEIRRGSSSQSMEATDTSRSVSFVRTDGVPHEESTSKEIFSVIRSNLDITSSMSQPPKASILKIPKISRKSVDSIISNATSTHFNPQVHTRESGTLENIEELKTQSMHDHEFPRYRARDSIVVTAQRLSRGGYTSNASLSKALTQQEVEDSDVNAKAFEKENLKGGSTPTSNNKHNYLPERDYSDIYENYDTNHITMAYFHNQQDEHKNDTNSRGIKINYVSKNKLEEDRHNNDDYNTDEKIAKAQVETWNNSKNDRDYKNHVDEKSKNHITESQQQSQHCRCNTVEKILRSKVHLETLNEGKEVNKDNYDETKKGFKSENIQTQHGIGRPYKECLRENCLTFACSEICIKEYKN